MKASDILYIVVSCQMSVAEDLHRIFSQLKMNFATLSESSQARLNSDREAWYTSRELSSLAEGGNIYAYMLQGLHTMQLSTR